LARSLPAISLDIESLTAASSFWEYAGYIATLIVLIGCVGESVVEFTNWLKVGNLKRRVGVISACLLILGVAGEIYTQVQANSVNSLIIALLNKQNTELLAKIAPRRLSGDQSSALMASLRSFEGRKIRIESYALDTDGEVLASQIKTAVSPIFSPIDDWIGGEPARGPFVKGISVTGRDGALVDALVKSLSVADLKGVSNVPPSPPNESMLLLSQSRTKSDDVDAVILVGVKPLAGP
jgi:hypothetical protein